MDLIIVDREAKQFFFFLLFLCTINFNTFKYNNYPIIFSEDVITVLGTRTEFSHIFADDNEGRRKKTI